MDAAQVQQVADSLRRYLQAHPQAGDTVAGVHRWWVQWPGTKAPLAVTQAALEALQAAGVARCRHGIWSSAARPDGKASP